VTRATSAPISRGARSLASVLAVALTLAACGSGADGGASAERSGASAADGHRPAPPVVTLDELVARVEPPAPERPLLVNFWATWCAPCVAELPELAAIAAERADEIDVIAVSLDLANPLTPGVETAADVQRFLDARGIELPVLIVDGTPEDIAARLALPGAIPFTYAWSRDGRRVAERNRQLTREELEELVAAALR
jgi:thiol-disulfide isomerase/thioredoxin